MSTIESDVPIPAAKKKQTRARKPKSENNGGAALLAALKFVSAAQKEIGTPYEVHCLMDNSWCVAFNGVLTIGCKIAESITACPKTIDMLEALQKCGETLSITQLNEYVLSIKSNKFKASIDCIAFSSIPLSYPDAPVAIINDEIKNAFNAIAWLATEGSDKAYLASVLLQSGSAVATNRNVLLEYWHGCDLPPSLLIPKATATIMSKVDKKLTHFGCSDTSATFYYEDGSFIKTQLFKDHFPNYHDIFAKNTNNYAPLPADFYKAVRSVEPLAKDGFVYLRGNKVLSNQLEGIGAAYEIEGIPNKVCFNPEYLIKLEPHFKTISIVDGSIAFFYSEKVRGVLMGGSKP